MASPEIPQAAQSPKPSLSGSTGDVTSPVTPTQDDEERKKRDAVKIQKMNMASMKKVKGGST